MNYISKKLFKMFLADQNKISCGRGSFPTLHKDRICAGGSPVKTFSINKFQYDKKLIYLMYVAAC